MFAGRYELVDPIGTGGMGSVWRTFDHRDGTFCAAKVLRQSDAATVVRFVREQSLRIRHPHVVAPRNWVGEDDRVLFTMDLVRGGSTATVVHDHGPLPASYVAVLLEQLLAALDAVHDAGVVHRDVKPSNLLLEPTGLDRPFSRLTDFGIAVKRSEPRLTSTGMLLGTPGYLAPETFAGADPEPRQDLYSAGLTGIELLTGMKPPTPPAVRGEPSEQDRRAREASPRGADHPVPEMPPHGVDPGLWELLRRLCAPDPDARPAGAADAREELLAITDSRHPDAPLVAPAGVPGAWHAGPEPVEVFDQVGPLPDGWRSRGGGYGGSTSPGSVPIAVPSGPPGENGPAGAGTSLIAAGPRAEPDAGTVPIPQPVPPLGRSHSGRWPLLLATVLVGVTVGVGTTQLPWPTAGAEAGSAERRDGAAGTGPSEGDACSFVEVGARIGDSGDVSGPAALACTKMSDGDYRWRTP